MMKHGEERNGELQGGIQYKVIFAARRTISIIVSPHKGVIVRAPYRTPLKTIERFVSEKSGWIQKHLRQHAELIRMNKQLCLSDGDSLPYMGELLPVKLISGNELFIRSDGNIIEIGIITGTRREVIDGMVRNWYRHRAGKVFHNKMLIILNRYADYDFRPAALTVRTLKSRWGSCSLKGRITLNSELLKLDEKYIDYVIIHELCHLKHHNHGKAFYDLLSGLCPDYKVIKKEMSRFITR